MTAGSSAGFAAFVGRFAARFPRVESRRHMRTYVWGLLGDVARKNGWTLAAAAGDTGPQHLQRLLNFYAWDVDGVRDDLRTAVVQALGARDGVLIVDETAFVKKGTRSAGVARQYSAPAGRIENVQIGVFLAYATRRGQALIDRELYLPTEWTNDRDRCRRAGIGDEVVFATKPALAQRMIDRAVRARVPFGWVTGNEAYGRDSRLRAWLQAKDIAHVLAIPSSEIVPARPATRAGGEHGPRWHDWTVVDLHPPRRPGRRHWLLTRGDQAQIAHYVCFGPAEATMTELSRVAAARVTIGHCLHHARTQAGLDQYQVRGYHTWYRHVTLAMVAAAYLVITHTGR